MEPISILSIFFNLVSMSASDEVSINASLNNQYSSVYEAKQNIFDNSEINLKPAYIKNIQDYKLVMSIN